ncbi:MAG: formylglycine-generating enzyme family protein [Cyclobacteriaceae bacterium]|nr:formylglycine-generating enzyme family protein [Cyclobacteriaceae bacterium]
MGRLLVNIFIILVLLNVSCSKKPSKESAPLPGMVWIPGGDFIMGTNETEAYDHERPAHKVHVSGFWMSETEVTNEQFMKFIDATGYKTVAERKPTWEDLKSSLPPDTPAPPDSLLMAGSLVFIQPDQPVMLNDYSQWWAFVPDADWQNPEGPESNLEGRWNHPVVQIAFEDAIAYCKWEGSRLPTEAEWEFASRGGKEQARYGWGGEMNPKKSYMANTFQGSFPVRNLKEDGFELSSPVKSFPANEYGLYDMIGNAWEWTSDFYTADYFQTIAANSITNDPKGPASSYDPNDPYAIKRVTKGGSFLCASNYCSNYRPSARQATSIDSGSSNIGFRTVK